MSYRDCIVDEITKAAALENKIVFVETTDETLLPQIVNAPVFERYNKDIRYLLTLRLDKEPFFATEPSLTEESINRGCLYIIHLNTYDKKRSEMLFAALSLWVDISLGLIDCNSKVGNIDSGIIRHIRNSFIIVVADAHVDSIPNLVAQNSVTLDYLRLDGRSAYDIANGYLKEYGIGIHALSNYSKRIAAEIKGLSRAQAIRVLTELFAGDPEAYLSGDNDLRGDVTRKKCELFLSNRLLEPMLVPEKERTKAVGIDAIDNWLEENSDVIKNPEQARRERLASPISGILVTGIPGAGKSLTCEAIARKTKLPVVKLEMGKILDQFVGNSEKNFAQALEQAHDFASPGILFIDELEKAFSGANGQGNESTRRIAGMLLTFLQTNKSGCFVFATSNSLNGLPPELFRQGRFQEKFFYPLMAKADLVKLLANYLESQNKEFYEMHGKWLFAPHSVSKITDKFGEFLDDSSMDSTGHKFWTGSDVGAFIEKVKSKIPRSTDVNPDYLYGDSFCDTMEDEYPKFRTYGDTNILDIYRVYIDAAKNAFTCCASEEHTIVPLEDIHLMNAKYRKDEQSSDRVYKTTGADCAYDRRIEENLSSFLNGENAVEYIKRSLNQS